MKIPIINPTTSLTEKTWLTADYVAGGTSLSVKNSTNFAGNDLVLLGEPGFEQTEVKQVNGNPDSVSAMTIVAGSFNHSKDDPVYKVLFDQAEIYKSTDAGATYSLLTTINLQYDKPVTIFDYLAGAATDYYKIKLKNSVTSAVSDFSDAQIGTGWPRNAVGRMVRNVRRYLKDLEGMKFKDWEIMEELKNASDDVIGEIPNAWWTLFSKEVVTDDDVSIYGLESDFRAMLFLIYRLSTSEEYPLGYVSPDEWVALNADTTAANNDDLDKWTILPPDANNQKGYFEVYPTPLTASKVMTEWYFRSEPDMNSYGDLVLCPTPQIYEYRAASILTDDADDAKKYNKRYVECLSNLKVAQRRNRGPIELRRWLGVDGKGKLYGRGASYVTQNYKETHW